MIDMILTNNRRLFNDVKVIPSVSLDGDHRLVLAQLRIREPKQQVKSIRMRFKLEKLKEEDCKRDFKCKVEEKLDLNVNNKVEEEWKQFKDSLSKAAEETIGMSKQYGGKKKKTPWWTNELQNAVKDKMKKFRKWMKNRNPEDRAEYVIARNEAERIKKEEKRRIYIKIGEDLKEDYKGTRKLLYSMAKNYRGKNKEITRTIKKDNGTLLTEPKEVAERWKEYFNDLLNVEGIMDTTTENENTIPLHDRNEEVLITEDEVAQAIKRMSTGKAAGEDGLPMELIKAAGRTATQALVKLFNSAFTSETIPDDWGRGVICPIFKKGDKTVCSNYRGITLLSHVGKIYTRIIEMRLRGYVESKLGESQYGFRPGRSTTDLIFALKMCLEKSWEWNIEKFILFMDLEKAFDRIRRQNLWNILGDRYYGIPTKL